LLQTNAGTLPRQGRVFAKLFDQEFLAAIEKRVVDGGSTEIDSGDNWFRIASL
jgi:hypothetical protein